MTAPKNIRADLGEIDPTKYPILAAHWPDVEPNWKSLGGIFAGIIDRIEVERSPDDDQEAAA